MADAGPGLVVLFLVFAVVGPFVLYILVREEHNRRKRMDRETAEQTARRDGDDEERQ